jgi:phospholipid/cholesterol/gamma-HCH transport system substrate-binding protein
VKHAIRTHARDFVAVFVLIAVAIGVSAYIVIHQRLRLPLVHEKPFVLKAEFSDAQAVLPGQGQTVRVAGMRVGDIGDVSLENGVAVVELELDREHRKLVHGDATALLRPRTGLKDMFIELDPGSRDEPVLQEGDAIPVENTAPDVDADEILSALDRDTRDYLVLLINGVGGGLRERGGDLREVFRRLGPLHRDIRRLNSAIAERRRNLARLVHDYGGTVDELGRRDGDLRRLVTSASAVFESWAREEDNISLAISRLPGTLGQVERTLVRVEELGRVMPPAFEALRPAVRQLDATNDQVRPFALEATPILRDEIRPFAREAQPYVSRLRPAVRGLGDASPDLRESFRELNRFFNMASYNPGGRERLSGDFAADRQRDEGFLFWLAWTSQNGLSVFSTADASGPFRRIILSATCTTFLGQVQEEPAREILFNLTDLLSDPGICPKE